MMNTKDRWVPKDNRENENAQAFWMFVSKPRIRLGSPSARHRSGA